MSPANSTLTFPPPDNSVGEQLGRVTDRLVDGDLTGAREQIASIAGVTRASHELELMPTLAHSGRPAGTGVKSGRIPTDLVASVYVRDGFTCLYCGRWTIPNAVLRLISIALPDELPYQQFWRKDIAARVYPDISTSVDHMYPVSAGGPTQDPDNLATVCARCNYQKSNISLVSLGWNVRRDWPKWDGHTDKFQPLWEQVGRPADSGITTWLKAFNSIRDETPSA